MRLIIDLYIDIDTSNSNDYISIIIIINIIMLAIIAIDCFRDSAQNFKYITTDITKYTH